MSRWTGTDQGQNLKHTVETKLRQHQVAFPTFEIPTHVVNDSGPQTYNREKGDIISNQERNQSKGVRVQYAVSPLHTELCDEELEMGAGIQYLMP